MAGSVGAAVAGVTVARDAAPAPPVATLRITPNGLGMAGLTEYRFDGNGSSDPNEDVLTYSWDFGDGSRGTGVTATHIYAAAGTYEVTLTVSDGSAEATSRGSVRVGPNLNGVFRGELPRDHPGGCGHWTDTLYLTMNGTMLSGRREDAFSESWPATVSWSVRGYIRSSDNFLCPCEIHLDATLTGWTLQIPDEDYRMHGISGTVSEGADRIESYVTFYRQ